jgi:KTSC domain
MQKAAMLPTCLPLFVAIICVASAFCEEPTNGSKHVVSHIPRQDVQSSAIAKIGYSKRRHILEIEFVNGAVYRYFDVPLSVYDDLMSAKSKARFYDSNIRKHYRSVLVRSRQKQQSPQQSPESALQDGAAAHE